MSENELNKGKKTVKQPRAASVMDDELNKKKREKKSLKI